MGMIVLNKDGVYAFFCIFPVMKSLHEKPSIVSKHIWLSQKDPGE